MEEAKSYRAIRAMKPKEQDQYRKAFWTNMTFYSDVSGYSQKEIAEKIGYPQKAFNSAKYRNSLLSYPQCQGIAKLLGMSVDALFSTNMIDSESSHVELGEDAALQKHEEEASGHVIDGEKENAYEILGAKDKETKYLVDMVISLDDRSKLLLKGFLTGLKKSIELK